MHLGIFARSNSLNANHHLERFGTFDVVFPMSVEVQVPTVPHFKGLISGLEDVGSPLV